MSTLEFVDTNVLIYAHDANSGSRNIRAVQFLHDLVARRAVALSTQVLVEFYSTATRKLGISSETAEAAIVEMRFWTTHRPALEDLVSSAQLQRRFQISWWDALVLQSASALGCSMIWSEDFADGQRYGNVLARNPFV